MEAGSGDEGEMLLVEDKGPPDCGDCATNLLSYAAPLAVHRKMLSVICAVQSRTHLILLTRTANLGLLVAGRGFGLESHRLRGRVLEVQYGARGVPAQAADDVIRDGGRTRGAAQYRSRSDFQFQVVQAHPVQPVLLRDVTRPRRIAERASTTTRPASTRCSGAV